ncbi:zinc-binding dehydrogenase [Streptomyces sp. CB03234]|uniref:zinc-binding dehydrogenase n=1 Tax=Streptomyces sp. (strain CB03234) TaxID=1703937 RepID=UPI001F51DBFC|nr:zinc-binding dehydrogenase [Streptomyces sp. CB03234]
MRHVGVGRCTQKRWSGGRGAAYVFDAVAGPAVMELARAVAADGTLFLWRAQSGQPTPCPGFDLGTPALNMHVHDAGDRRDPRRLRRAAAFATSGLRGGSLRPVVDRLFPLEDTVRAHQRMECSTRFGKIVVTVAH